MKNAILQVFKSWIMVASAIIYAFIHLIIPGVLMITILYTICVYPIYWIVCKN